MTASWSICVATAGAGLSARAGTRARAFYDRSTRRWRHLDMAGTQLWLRAEIRRLECPTCGVRTERVAWARPGSRFTIDFEDLVAWLAQRSAKSTVAELMRCSWESVDRIVTSVVAEHLDDSRWDGLVHLGVDEIAYRNGHRYLTVVVDHDTNRVVWAARDTPKKRSPGSTPRSVNSAAPRSKRSRWT